MAYLRQMRVERMAGLLASTDLSVAEAVCTVGWNSTAKRARGASEGGPRSARARCGSPCDRRTSGAVCSAADEAL